MEEEVGEIRSEEEAGGCDDVWDGCELSEDGGRRRSGGWRGEVTGGDEILPG